MYSNGDQKEIKNKKVLEDRTEGVKDGSNERKDK